MEEEIDRERERERERENLIAVEPDVGEEDHHGVGVLVLEHLQLDRALATGGARTAEEVGVAKVRPRHLRRQRRAQSVSKLGKTRSNYLNARKQTV